MSPCRRSEVMRAASASSRQREHAALAGGEILVGVEAEAGDVADRADLAAVGEPRLGGVRGVLDEPQPVPLAGRLERRQVARVPRVVHRHDGARARRHGGLDRRGVEAERRLVDVAEDRPGAGAHDHVGRGGPGQRRRDDLVAVSLADAERAQREVHRGRAGGDRERVLAPRRRAANSLSSCRANGPVVSQPVSSECSTLARSSSPSAGGAKSSRCSPRTALAAGDGGEIDRNGHGAQDRAGWPGTPGSGSECEDAGMGER